MGTKRVQKTKQVAKTRQVPGTGGVPATEVYYDTETYYEDVYVPDTSSSSTYDSGSYGGSE